MGSEKGSKVSVRLENDTVADEKTKLQIEEPPTPVKGPVKNVDDFLRMGWYTFYAGITAEFVVFNMLSNMIYMVYAGAAPVVKSCGNFHGNASDSDICDQYALWRPQNECVPQLEYQFLSANVEFDYLCGEGKAVKNSISVQMLGVLLGTILFGQMSDSFGRRTVLLICTTAAIVLGAAGSFANSLWSLTLWRAATGFFAGGEVIVLNVYLMEQVPKNHRLWISTVVTWSPNFIVLAGVAYLSYDWRSLARAISLFSLPVIPLLYFSLESPRWLFQKGKIEETRKALRRIRGKKASEDPKVQMEIERMLAAEAKRTDDAANRKQHYPYHLFYTWQLTRYTVVIASGLFVTSIINYGLLFNMEKLSGSIYLNSAFFGLFRWSMNVSVGAIDYFVKCAGRKKIHFFAMAFIAAAIAIAFAIYAFKLTPDYQFLIRYCALAAAAMCSQLYLTKTVVMVELYPTAVRNIATSFMGLLSRVGNTLAPQIFYLSDYWKPLPYLTMMILALIDLSDFQLFIPETKGKPLKDHLPGPEKCIWRRKKPAASTTTTDKGEAEMKENGV